MMTAAWGTKWCSHLEAEHLETTMSIWEASTSKLTDDQLLAGIKKCIATLDFPPSIAQFRKAALGIVSAEQAYTMVNSDELAGMAWRYVDSWLKKTGTEKEVKQAFVAMYNSITDKMLMG